MPGFIKNVFKSWTLILFLLATNFKKDVSGEVNNEQTATEAIISNGEIESSVAETTLNEAKEENLKETDLTSKEIPTSETQLNDASTEHLISNQEQNEKVSESISSTPTESGIENVVTESNLIMESSTSHLEENVNAVKEKEESTTSIENLLTASLSEEESFEDDSDDIFAGVSPNPDLMITHKVPELPQITVTVRQTEPTPTPPKRTFTIFPLLPPLGNFNPYNFAPQTKYTGLNTNFKLGVLFPFG